MPTPADTDENGDTFEVWLTRRSCAMLVPVCRLGLAIALLFLCIADPLYHFLALWSPVVAHGWLLAWHVAVAAFFAAMLMACPRARTQAQQLLLLRVFVGTTALLFVWFGVVSWLGTGDLSVVAIAQILLASVFCMPGHWRRWSYALQALATGLLLAWLDSSAKFLGQLQFANLLVIAAVALVMDAYMLRNAHTLFTQKCRVVQERRRADAVLYNAMPADIAEELKLHQRVQAQSHPAMAILFADLVGFTTWAAQRTPDQVLALLNELFSEMDALVEVHQVEKIKTIGDAYMAVSREGPHALATLALSMLQALQRFNSRRGTQLALRMGLHCGPVVAGVIGTKRLSYDVWGDAVNLASRLESGGEGGRIHVSEPVYQALQTHFDFEARGLVEIRGKGLLATYFLAGPRPARAAMVAAAQDARDSMQSSFLTASGYTP